jgi:kynureninase
VDAYHHLNVVPFDVTAMRLEHAFVTGGGYKYCQLGEGNAFLRVPGHENLRPVLTGWFAEFSDRQSPHQDGVSYPGGAAAFMGATYDPTSHYRAAAVFEFHQQHGLDAEPLRAISQRQVSLLKMQFERQDLDPGIARIVGMPDGRRGGFLAIRAGNAAGLTTRLREQGVWSDARGDLLRFGPAPYLSDAQLVEAMDILGRIVRRS